MLFFSMNGIGCVLSSVSCFVLWMFLSCVLIVLGLMVLGVLLSRLSIMLWLVLWFLLVVLSELYSLIFMWVVVLSSLLCLRFWMNISVVCIGLIVCELDGLMLILKRLNMLIVILIFVL